MARGAKEALLECVVVRQQMVLKHRIKFDCETTSNVKVFQGNVHFWNIASRSMATLELLRV